MVRDRAKLSKLCGAHWRGEMIQLHGVRPGRKVGIPAQAPGIEALRAFRPGKSWMDPVEIFACLERRTRVLVSPRMVERSVVADEIEKQPYTARVQFLADAVEFVPRADSGIGNVVRDRVGRTDHIRGLPSGQCAIVLRNVCGIGERDSARLGASPPDAHEPDGVESELRKRVPLCIGNFGEFD